jgi:hypothetical protein
MPIPTMPIAHFILIQARFAFGLFDALFDGVASRGDLGQGCIVSDPVRQIGHEK